MEFHKILNNECWRFVSRRLPFKKNAVTLGKKKRKKPDCGGRNVAEFARGSWFHVGWCCLVTSVDWAESDFRFSAKNAARKIIMFLNVFYTLRIFKVLRLKRNYWPKWREFAVGSEDAVLSSVAVRSSPSCLQKCSWCLSAVVANSNLQNRIYLVNSRYNVDWF